MRSSRVSRQTAQIIEVTGGSRGQGKDTPGQDEESEPDSPLSTPPKSPEEEHATATTSITVTPRKRKRGQHTETAAPKAISRLTAETTATSTRMSARKTVNGASQRPKKARRQPAKPVKDVDGSVVKVEPPPNWDEVYKLTEEMRGLWQAPVDTMGCESLAEDRRTPRDKRFQTLIALMLSSQTKDGVTAAAMTNMQEELPGVSSASILRRFFVLGMLLTYLTTKGFTLESMLAVEPAKLNSLIEKVGFHNNKTKYIKAAAEILATKHGSDIPDTIEGLVALPGVGPKMAYLCMSAAWGRDEGIGVDVHVHRITNLWGWHKTQTPEQTRAALEGWLPREKWHDINHLLVGFGQTWCPPVGRKCEECKLAERGLCPSAVVKKSVKEKVKKEKIAVKSEDGSEGIEQKTTVQIDVERVKAEDLVKDEDMARDLQDIEDLGRGSRTRSKRTV